MLPESIRLAISHTWQIVILILLVWILCRTVARRRAHLAHLLWLVVMLKCLTPPVWSSPVGIFCWLQTRDAPARIIENSSAVRPTILAERTGLMLEHRRRVPDTSPSQIHNRRRQPEANERIASFNREPTESKTTPYAWRSLLFGWIMTSSALMTISFVRVARYLRRAMNDRCTASGDVEALLSRLKTKLRVRRPVELIVTRAHIGPAVLGLLRPVILLPELMLGGRTIEQLEPILAHELLHIRRGDLWIGMLQVLAQAIWWFNPLVWYASRTLSREAERCCDEEAVASLNCSPARYARSLLSVLEFKHSLQAVPAVPGVRAVDITSKRLERIMSLGHGGHKRSPVCRWATMLVACIITLPGAMLALGDDPPRSEPQPVKSAEFEVATERAADNTDDQAVIVIHAIVAKGPTNAIRSIAANWDVLPASVATGSDSFPQDNFSSDTGSPHTKIGSPTVASASGQSRTVIERDEPVLHAICDSGKRRDIIDRLQGHTRINVYSCPKITVRDGQVATIKDAIQRPFVVGVKQDKPQVRVISEGLTMTLRPTIQKDRNVWLDFDAQLCQVRRVTSATYESFEVQVPEVAKTQAHLLIHVPLDKTLILGGLKRDIEESGSESMLVLVNCELVHPPAASKGHSAQNLVDPGVKADEGSSRIADVVEDEPQLNELSSETFWDLSLDECIQISLQNSKPIRSLVNIRRAGINEISAQPLGRGASVLLSRIDPGAPMAQTRAAIRNHLLEVERAFWDLYYYYRNLEIAKLSRDDGLETWKSVNSLGDSVNQDEDGQTREQYFFFRGRTEEAKRDLVIAERQLRFLMGIAPLDGRVIRTKDTLELVKEYQPDYKELLPKALSASLERDQLTQRMIRLQDGDASDDASISRQQAIIADVELEIAHALSDAVQRFNSNYALAETACLQREAARVQAETLKAKYQAGAVSLDAFLDAQRRSADAARAFYQSLTQNKMAQLEVQFRSGELLDSHGLIVQ